MRKAETLRTKAKEALKAQKAEVQRLQQAVEEQVLEKEALVAEVAGLEAQKSKQAETMAALARERDQLEQALNTRKMDFQQADEQYVFNANTNSHKT
eukprot:m.212518 g.212518  ORF g.212518 m.212518 type:complete len:97 (+) comp16946_c2_seq39:2987-3277(+)